MTKRTWRVSYGQDRIREVTAEDFFVDEGILVFFNCDGQEHETVAAFNEWIFVEKGEESKTIN